MDDGGRRETAPGGLWDRTNRFRPVVDELLGRRLVEQRRQPDSGTLLTVLDLDADDVTAVAEVAARFDLTGWVRLERADPAHLAAWAELRADLDRLEGADRRLLSAWPGPMLYRRPPVLIGLTAVPEAVAAAADLHQRYGDFVSLRVGALRYPLDRNPEPEAAGPAPGEPVDPGELTTALDGPLTVRPGDTVTHTLLVTNHGDHRVVLHTDGDVRGEVLDPATGVTIGRYAGAHVQPLISFVVDPGETTSVPLLVGTASCSPALGYAVPAGVWPLVARLDLADDRRLVSAPMDLTVTD